MTGLGQIIVDDGGRILTVDRTFCITMRATADALIDRNILDLTAPADRERCIAVLANVRTATEPLFTVKRMIRFDGSHLWVHNTVTVQTSDTGLRIAISIAESAPPMDWVDPAELLNLARFIFDGRRLRETAFPGRLFSDHAWDILLLAYITEAEGRALTTKAIHADIGISLVNVARWMRALSAEGLLEFEDGGNAEPASTLRLSFVAHSRFERFLSDIHRSRDESAPDLAIFR